MNKRLQNLLIVVILAIVAFLICMQVPANIFTNNMEEPVDSSVFKYIGWSMTKGKVPYLELFDHKGILLYFINYIGTFLSPIHGIWFIEFIFMFVSVLFTYKLARKFCKKSISLLIMLISFVPMYHYFDKGNFTEEYALPFQMISLNIFFDFFLHPNRYFGYKKKDSFIKLDFKWFNIPICICGICFACVLFLRANMISIWCIFCIMVLIYCIAKKKYQELIKFIISFISGIFIIALPILIYIVQHGALQSFINDYLIFNMKYTDNKGKISKLNVFIQFCSAVPVMLALLIVSIKLYAQIKNKEKWKFNLVYFIFMIATILLTSMSGKFYYHYGMSIVPILVYPYCILYQFLEGKKLKNGGLKLIVTGYLLITLVIPTGLNFTKDFLNKIDNKDKPAYTNKAIEYIKSNTQESDLISVFGNKNYIYYLANRESASRYSYQLPIAEIDKGIMTEYLEDLKEKQPKIIVYALTNEIEKGYYKSANIMKKFLQDNNYKLVEKTNDMQIYTLEIGVEK